MQGIDEPYEDDPRNYCEYPLRFYSVAGISRQEICGKHPSFSARPVLHPALKPVVAKFFCFSHLADGLGDEHINWEIVNLEASDRLRTVTERRKQLVVVPSLDKKEEPF